MTRAPEELDPNVFPSKRISWSDLKAIIERQELFSLQRSVKQERFYRNYSNKIKQIWNSIYDFILHHKFNYEVTSVSVSVSSTCEVESADSTTSFVEYHEDDCDGDLSLLPPVNPPPSGMQWAAKAPVDNNTSKGKALVLNDFPYYFEDGVEHWCLWKLGSDVTQEDLDWAIEDLSKRGYFSEFLHWVNPVHLKSLIDIDHAHIVCLRKDRPSCSLAKDGTKD